MQELLNKILSILREHVRQNMKEIEYNQEDIQRLLRQTVSAKNKQELDYKNGLNKELIGENKDFEKMQMELNEFMGKYGHLFNSKADREIPSEISDVPEKLSFFDQTIKGKIKFDTSHPQFNNPRFFNQLLKYYQDKEDYEKCEELIRIKGN